MNWIKRKDGKFNGSTGTYKIVHGKDIMDIVSKWTAVILVILIGVGMVVAINRAFASTVVKYEKETVEVQVDNLTPKVEQLTNEMLDKLEKCESGDYDESDGIIIFDSNNQASIGTFQFQKKTVIHYYKTLYGQDITSKEAVLIALDSVKARQLAKDIIFSSSEFKDWKICGKKLQSDLEFINKLVE